MKSRAQAKHRKTILRHTTLKLPRVEDQIVKAVREKRCIAFSRTILRMLPAFQGTHGRQRTNVWLKLSDKTMLPELQSLQHRDGHRAI